LPNRQYFHRRGKRALSNGQYLRRAWLSNPNGEWFHQQDGDALLMRRVRQVFGNFCPQRLPCASLSGLFVSERGKISQFFAWASKMGTAFA
jgi:hypothetical protein